MIAQVPVQVRGLLLLVLLLLQVITTTATACYHRLLLLLPLPPATPQGTDYYRRLLATGPHLEQYPSEVKSLHPNRFRCALQLPGEC